LGCEELRDILLETLQTETDSTCAIELANSLRGLGLHKTPNFDNYILQNTFKFFDLIEVLKNLRLVCRKFKSVIDNFPIFAQTSERTFIPLLESAQNEEEISPFMIRLLKSIKFFEFELDEDIRLPQILRFLNHCSGLHCLFLKTSWNYFNQYSPSEFHQNFRTSFLIILQKHAHSLRNLEIPSFYFPRVEFPNLQEISVCVSDNSVENFEEELDFILKNSFCLKRITFCGPHTPSIIAHIEEHYSKYCVFYDGDNDKPLLDDLPFKMTNFIKDVEDFLEQSYIDSLEIISIVNDFYDDFKENFFPNVEELASLENLKHVLLIHEDYEDCVNDERECCGVTPQNFEKIIPIEDHLKWKKAFQIFSDSNINILKSNRDFLKMEKTICTDLKWRFRFK
jgi:hypothetical protein